MNPQMIAVPRSSKAKNRLANMMNNDPIVTIEQETQTQFFCASTNQKHFFWVDKTNDPNWSMLPLQQ